MTKNLDEQGEAKSAPQELPKLRTHKCETCGLVGPSPMVAASGFCGNARACARRVERTAQRLAAHQQPRKT